METPDVHFEEHCMKSALAAAFVFALGAVASAQSTTTEQVKKLIAAGLGDDVIVAFIESRGGLEKLSADDTVALKEAGASDALLKRLIDGIAPVPPPAPAPAPEIVQPAPVVVEPVSTTTVVSLPASWYTYGPRTSYIPTVLPPGAVAYRDPTPCRPRIYRPTCAPPPICRPVVRPPCAPRVVYHQRSVASRYGGYRGRCR
jgi:hypothetical protein